MQKESAPCLHVGWHLATGHVSESWLLGVRPTLHCDPLCVCELWRRKREVAELAHSTYLE